MSKNVGRSFRVHLHLVRHYQKVMLARWRVDANGMKVNQSSDMLFYLEMWSDAPLAFYYPSSFRTLISDKVLNDNNLPVNLCLFDLQAQTQPYDIWVLHPWPDVRGKWLPSECNHTLSCEFHGTFFRKNLFGSEWRKTNHFWPCLNFATYCVCQFER